MKSERTARIVAGLLLVPCFLFLGLAAGVTIATLNSTGMGWDRLADAVGGMMVGAVAGLILALLVARHLPVAKLRTAAIASIAATLLVWSVLAVRARNRQTLRNADAPPTAISPQNDARPTTTTPTSTR
jgi:hypothetical protein